jgi:hypothetical protein
LKKVSHRVLPENTGRTVRAIVFLSSATASARGAFSPPPQPVARRCPRRSGGINGSGNLTLTTVANSLGNVDNKVSIGTSGSLLGNILITSQNTTNNMTLRLGAPNALPATAEVTGRRRQWQWDQQVRTGPVRIRPDANPNFSHSEKRHTTAYVVFQQILGGPQILCRSP